MKSHLLFPTIVWEEHVPVHDNYANYVYNLRRNDPEGIQRSNRNGWHSKALDNVPYVADKILEIARIVATEHSYVDADPYIQQAWYNISGAQSVNLPHQHPQSFLSGVYYIKVSDDAGPIKFYRNTNEAFILESLGSYKELNTLNSPTAAFRPENGKLLLFPSWLMHGVDVNGDDEDRISLAFSVGI